MGIGAKERQIRYSACCVVKEPAANWQHSRTLNESAIRLCNENKFIACLARLEIRSRGFKNRLAEIPACLRRGGRGR